MSERKQDVGTSVSDAAVAMDCIDRLNRSAASPVSQWLNSELAHAPDTTNGASKLEEAVQPLRQLSVSLATVQDQYRSEMEHLIASLVSTIPNLAVELHLMSETAKSLDDRIRTLQISNSPLSDRDEGRQALTQIATLSRAKAQMIAARHTLREAQSWTTLEAEFALMTGEARFEEAVRRLINARSSLRMFQEAASPTSSSASLTSGSYSIQERSELLLKLNSDLEAKLVPALQQALVDRDSESTVRLASLFVQMGSVDQTFVPVYLRSRSGDVLLKWTKKSSVEPASPTSNHLVTQVTALLSDSMALLGEERIFGSNLFSDPRRASQMLLHHILSHLEPSLDLCIAQAAQSAGKNTEKFLSNLTETWKVVDESFSSFTDILAPEQGQTNSSATSTRPINLAVSTSHGDWQRNMLEPFLPYQTQFPQLEAQAMRLRLESIMSQHGIASTSISNQVAQAIAIVKGSMKRSADLTNSVSLVGLISHLDQLLASVLDQCRQSEERQGERVLRDVDERIKKSYANSHFGAGGGGTTAGSSMVDERAESLTQVEWDHFRDRTNKLAECRNASDAINQLELVLARQLAEVSVAQPLLDGTADFSSPSACIASSSLNSSLLHSGLAIAKRSLLLLQNQSSPQIEFQETLLPIARESLATLTRTLHQTQHRLVLTPFTQTDLQSYPHLAIWHSNKRPGLPANEYDLAMPKFSLSPTDQMAHIGEAMLNLPRLFEGLADEALLFGLHLYHQQKRKAIEVAGTSRIDTHARHRKAFSMAEAIDPSLPSDRGLTNPIAPENNGDLEATDDDSTEDADTDTASDPTARILNRYLRSLLRAFFAQFLGSTLLQLVPDARTPILSEIGTSQLASDLEYLSNITSVLWSPSERVLLPYRQCVEMTDATGRRLLEHRRLGTLPHDTDTDKDAQFAPLLQHDSPALVVVAKLRGWSTPHQ